MITSSNRPHSASSFESNTHFNIESTRRDSDRRSFLNSVLYVKSAFHTLLRTKSKVGFVRQSNRSAKGRRVRNVMNELYPAQPILGFKTMEQKIHERTAPKRIMTVTMGLFAGIALLLAGMRLYAVMTYAV